ncbi:hypothetical protein V2W45_1417819 [Cenococcum geophilum]
MFRWYRNAAKCYVYLSDVSSSSASRKSCPDSPLRSDYRGRRTARRCVKKTTRTRY